MVESERAISFRAYQVADYDAVASLWTRINRELAPAGMEEVFERYIATTIDGELMQLLQIFAEAKRNAFWVVEATNGIVGSFGIERRNERHRAPPHVPRPRLLRPRHCATDARVCSSTGTCARIHEDDFKHR